MQSISSESKPGGAHPSPGQATANVLQHEGLLQLWTQDQ